MPTPIQVLILESIVIILKRVLSSSDKVQGIGTSRGAADKKLRMIHVAANSTAYYCTVPAVLYIGR